ncbi:hypothetical protein CC1G_05234 [Coprinopsis cinerea okayama7|uniref:Uncharacterized protein n=1 Tax=Coprinopsis cinerea (strain Okayama-7 / 130 / ATCC MYA-4618 / FGSC 9003) TaxID=240176 RepID=A8PC98_COPC7|nr:hypothetical protein CC1G_05234 [Coprinopsis cinerea okayama7\|eukprot:XP_001840348.2 hypothetical protein CC1G_05234 [Coprinopsis cinerea okayama7\
MSQGPHRRVSTFKAASRTRPKGKVFPGALPMGEDSILEEASPGQEPAAGGEERVASSSQPLQRDSTMIIATESTRKVFPGALSFGESSFLDDSSVTMASPPATTPLLRRESTMKIDTDDQASTASLTRKGSAMQEDQLAEDEDCELPQALEQQGPSQPQTGYRPVDLSIAVINSEAALNSSPVKKPEDDIFLREIKRLAEQQAWQQALTEARKVADRAINLEEFSQARQREALKLKTPEERAALGLPEVDQDEDMEKPARKRRLYTIDERSEGHQIGMGHGEVLQRRGRDGGKKKTRRSKKGTKERKRREKERTVEREDRVEDGPSSNQQLGDARDPFLNPLAHPLPPKPNTRLPASVGGTRRERQKRYDSRYNPIAIVQHPDPAEEFIKAVEETRRREVERKKEEAAWKAEQERRQRQEAVEARARAEREAAAARLKAQLEEENKRLAEEAYIRQRADEVVKTARQLEREAALLRERENRIREALAREASFLEKQAHRIEQERISALHRQKHEAFEHQQHHGAREHHHQHPQQQQQPFPPQRPQTAQPPTREPSPDAMILDGASFYGPIAHFRAPPLTHQPSFRTLHSTYDLKWDALREVPDNTVRFASFPWPVLERVTGLENLTNENFTKFFKNEERFEFEHRNLKARLKPEILRWHPDKFIQLYGSKIHQDDIEAVIEGAGIVSRYLIELHSSL